MSTTYRVTLSMPMQGRPDIAATFAECLIALCRQRIDPETWAELETVASAMAHYTARPHQEAS